MLFRSSNPNDFKRLVTLATKSRPILDFIKSADAKLAATLPGGTTGQSLGGLAGQVPARANDQNANEIPAVGRQ